MTDDEIQQLLKAGSIWFRNSDFLLLERLIKHYLRLRRTIHDELHPNHSNV